MTEKIESMEIHPMRGHSRGEWYCSLADVAQSEDEAEYWAVFGITHRGNKHCLGEFPTKKAAKAAVQGLKSLCRPVKASRGRRKATQPEPWLSGRGRKVIQIEIVESRQDSTMVDVFALCSDGSIWRRGIGTGSHSGLIDNRWERIPLDGMGELSPEAALHAVIVSSH